MTVILKGTLYVLGSGISVYAQHHSLTHSSKAW